MNPAAVIYALAAAALFGISTPAAKALLGTIHPAVLAGLLYCGAGIGIAALAADVTEAAERALGQAARDTTATRSENRVFMWKFLCFGAT